MYRLNPEQQHITERVSNVAKDQIQPHASKVDETGTFPVHSIQALADEGLLGLTIFREYGGMGQDLRTMCAVLDEIAQSCASTAMIYLMHLCGIATYQAYPKNTSTQLADAAKGIHLSTLAFSERGSRSHFWAPVSKATANGKGVKFSANKSWVTSAGHANGYVVSTGWAAGNGSGECMLYLIMDSDDGFKISGNFNGLGMRGNGSSPMTFDNVALGTDRVLCDEGKGLDVMLGTVLPVFQLGSAAISIGIAEASVAITQQHLIGNRFEHTNERLADLPTLRARLATMRIDTDRARAHLVSVIDSIENSGDRTQLYVLEIKASASETAVRVTDAAMRACGGAAFSKHLGLERYFRDARASSVMAPTTDHANEFIGRVLCGMELF